MIGNDIVDLRDRDARPESFRARFDERVFSADERHAMAHDPVPLARRWAHWAAKEAAYKLAKQIDSTFVFTPARLVARFSSQGTTSGAVGARLERHGHLELPRRLGPGIATLELRSFETADYVHVIAVPVDSDWGGIDLMAESIDLDVDDPSAAVRAVAIREISRSLGVAAERLSIGREGRIPTVELDGMRTALSLSLSHHGGWIGYATRLHIDTQFHTDRTDQGIDSMAQATARMWVQ